MRINRRAFLGGTVVTMGFIGTASWQRLAEGIAADAPKTLPSAARAASLQLPLEGARVVEVHAITHGALPIVIEHRGDTFQVDVFRRDPALSGVVDTETFSVFVHNEGKGGRDTGATHELGARAVAIALENDEASRGLAAELGTFAEREARFPDGYFRVFGTV